MLLDRSSSGRAALRRGTPGISRSAVRGPGASRWGVSRRPPCWRSGCGTGPSHSRRCPARPLGALYRGGRGSRGLGPTQPRPPFLRSRSRKPPSRSQPSKRGATTWCSAATAFHWVGRLRLDYSKAGAVHCDRDGIAGLGDQRSCVRRHPTASSTTRCASSTQRLAPDIGSWTSRPSTRSLRWSRLEALTSPASGRAFDRSFADPPDTTAWFEPATVTLHPWTASYDRDGYPRHARKPNRVTRATPNARRSSRGWGTHIDHPTRWRDLQGPTSRSWPLPDAADRPSPCPMPRLEGGDLSARSGASTTSARSRRR